MWSLFKAVILAENVFYALKILAKKCSLRSFMASRKANRKFSQASRKPEKLRLGGLIATLDVPWRFNDICGGTLVFEIRQPPVVP